MCFLVFSYMFYVLSYMLLYIPMIFSYSHIFHVCPMRNSRSINSALGDAEIMHPSEWNLFWAMRRSGGKQVGSLTRAHDNILLWLSYEFGTIS